MSCPVHTKKRVKTCQRCVDEAKSAVGYGVEDGRVEAGGYLDDGKVEFRGKIYDTNEVKELFKLAGELEAMDYDPY